MKEIQILLLVLTLTLGLLFLLINRKLEGWLYYVIIKLAVMVCIISLIVVNIMIGYAVEGQSQLLQSLQYVPNLITENINQVVELKNVLMQPVEIVEEPKYKNIILNYIYTRATAANALPVVPIAYKGVIIGGSLIGKSKAAIFVASQVSTVIGIYPIIVPVAIATGWLSVGFGILYLIYS